MPLNYLSLFSGIGGLDLGLDRAGMTCVGQVERDPFCQRVLAKHWPEVPRHDDVRTCLDWWQSTDGPAVDVVAGGFPCQPVSVAGRQLAQADERWLWPAVNVIVRHLRPRWVLLENVPGLLGRGMGDVLGDLAEGGYDAEWDCIPAAAVGAPHRRDRVFVVAYPNGHPVRQQPVGLPGRRGSSVARDAGAYRAVADADGIEGGPLGSAVSSGRGEAVLGAGPEESRRRGGALANPDGDGPQRSRLPEARRGAGVADVDWRRPAVFGRGVRPGGEWQPEPGVGRVAHGVPARVDRVRALGNAVVPQVAEHIGRLIVSAA